MTRVPPDGQRGESVADLVGEIVQMRKEQVAEAARRAEKPRRSLVPLLLVLTVMAGGLTAWNVARATSPPERASPVQREATALVGIRVAALALDAYRDSTGGYPPSLEFVSAHGFGVTYTGLGSAYVLSVPVDTGLVTYTSGDPPPEFALIMEAIQAK